MTGGTIAADAEDRLIIEDCDGHAAQYETANEKRPRSSNCGIGTG